MASNRLLAALLLLLAAISATVAHGAPAIEIDRVEIEGVTVFPTEEIESVLEISPGDRLEKVKVVRTAEALQALYRVHGYEEAGIQSRISRRGSEAVLEFVVREGKPTRIAQVQFVAESIRDDSFKKYWRGIESDLASRVGLARGDIYDQEKASSGRRALQDMLASEEFVGARVDDVRVANASVPEGSQEKNVARWVTLTFHVDLGDRVTFGFRGNKAFGLSHLLSLVEEQRVIGFGKDYVGAIRGRIEDEYRSSGYANVRVQHYTRERPERQERHVTFAIQEGTRVGIGTVGFDGNVVFGNDELIEQFYERASPLVKHGYYSEREVQKSADLVVEWMKSRGYLGAKLITINTSPVSRTYARTRGAAVNLVIYVYEGDQTIVESIRINGFGSLTAEEIQLLLGAREGEPLNLFEFSEGIETVKAAYRSRGHLNARILNEETGDVVKYSDENRLASIVIDIDEGPRYRAGKIQIEGLADTREDVVRREILFREGDVLEESLLLASEARLRRLGIFALVTVRVVDDPDRPDHKGVRISVQEGTPGIIAGGVGFRNDLGIRLFGQVGYTNIGGRNHTVSLNAAINRRFEDYRFTEYFAQLSYLWPWFALGETTYRPSLAVSATQYRAFDAQTISLSNAWERRILRRPNLSFIFTHALERIEQFNAPTATGIPSDNPDNQTLRIGSVTPSLRMDTRDDPLSPNSGLLAAVSFEIASPYLGSQFEPFPVGFTRLQVRSDYFLPVSRDISWYFSYRSGFERNTQNPVLKADGSEDRSSGAIPVSRQYALGGAGSLRGFAEQELNEYDTIIRGTLSYVNYRTQLDLPLVGALRFGPFLDGANLLIDNFSFGGLRWGTGFGFHYQTPVGPVNLDVGFKLFPRPGEEPYRIYFSVGVI